MKTIILSETSEWQEVAKIRDDGTVLFQSLSGDSNSGWYPYSGFTLKIEEILKVADEYNKRMHAERAAKRQIAGIVE